MRRPTSPKYPLHRLPVFDINRLATVGNISEGDAIAMAISVYLDIYNLFLDLLYLIGGRRGSR
jgi:FtsH-binding integral membrane protein